MTTGSHITGCREINLFVMKYIIMCFCIMGLMTNGYSQSKIGKAENSVSRSSERSSSRDYDDDDSDGDGFFVETFGGIIVEALMYMTYYTLIETPFETQYPASQAPLTPYPYTNPKKGNYTFSMDEAYSPFRAEITGRYISENKAMKGMNVTLDMRFLKRMGFEFDYHQLWERNFNFGNDQLAFYNLMAKYYRIRAEQIDAWWGVGTTYIDGNVDQFGFTYGLGTELFFANPLSLEVNFKQTFINSETVNKLNLMLNFHIKRYKVIGGYEHLKIGSQRFPTFTLGGSLFL